MTDRTIYNYNPDEYSPTKKTHFHIVSISKLPILGILSVGLYISYCHYRHWQHLRGKREFSIASLICVFFGAITMYWLMKGIVAKCRTAEQAVEGTALGVTLMWWVPMLVSGGWDYALADTLSGSLPVSITLALPIILVLTNVVLSAVAMIQIQQAANACEGDPLGLTNSAITWANLLWVPIALLPFTAMFGYLASLGLPM